MYISGHQKKIMLAIDRLKRILSGSKRLSTIDGRRESAEVLEPPMTSIRWSGDRSSPPPPAPPVYNELPPYLKPRRSSSGDSLSTNSSGGEVKSLNQPLESEYANTSHLQPKQAAVVPIQVKRSMSQSTPNGITEGMETGAQGKMCQSFHAPQDRTSDYSDRENTPTGDEVDMAGGIPVAPKAIVKPKPVAKIVAKAKQSSREGSPDIIDIEKHEAERNNDGYKSPVKNLEGFKYPLATNGSLKRRTSEHIYDIPQAGPPRSTGNYVNYPPVSMQQLPQSPGGPLYVSTQYEQSRPPSGSPRTSQGSPGGRGKKAPPPPPKRTNSIRTAESKLGTSSEPSSVLSTPPPLHPKPTMAASPQQQAFVNCVQSLSERFGKNSSENAGDNLSSDGEDLPPPPPPVAMDLITPKVHNYGLLGKNDKTTSGEYMLQQRLKRDSSSAANNGNSGGESPFGVKLRQAQTESQPQPHANYVNIDQASAVMSQNSVQETLPKQNDSQTCVQNNLDETAKESVIRNGLDKKRKDSSGSECNASTSSLDSNTLPFANENVGTIKQRIPSAKPSLVMVLDDSGAPPDEDSDSVFSDDMDTIKRTSNNSQKMNMQHLQTQLQQQQLQQKLQQQQQKIQQQQQLQQQHLYENAQTCKNELRKSNSPPVQNASPADQQRHPSYNASVTASYIPGKQSPQTQQKQQQLKSKYHTSTIR